jgi:hypothetical protein
MSINYIQALPGTPVYEFARLKGLIGSSLLDEEQYLLSISDLDAEDDTKFLNFTSEDYLTVRSWRRKMVLEVMRHYHQRNKTHVPPLPVYLWRALKRKLFKEKPKPAATDMAIEEYSKGGYFNLSYDLGYDMIVSYFYPWRNVILAAWLLKDEFRRLPTAVFLGHVLDWFKHRFWRREDPLQTDSLRKVVAGLTPLPAGPTQRAMQPLRDGR